MHAEMERVGDDHPRFMQPLIHDFLLHFSIPVSFQKHLEGRSLERVVLMTEEDQPQRSWVVKTKDDRHFKDGWKEFCVAHNLKIGDFLVFTLKSQFVFHVSIFDSLTACHRHFASKPQASSQQAQVLSCCVSISDYSFKRAAVTLPKRFTKSCGLAKRRCNIKLIDEKTTPWLVKLSYKACGETSIGLGWKKFQIANNIGPGSVVIFKLIEAGRVPILKCSVDNKTTSACPQNSSASESLVSKANHKGSSGSAWFESSTKGTEDQESSKIPYEQTQYPHCYVTISDYYFKRSSICLPKHFMKSSGLENRCCFVKIINEKGIPWQVRLRCRPFNGQASLDQGWQAFVRANNVTRRSVICFQLIQAERIPILKCFQVCAFPLASAAV